MSQSVRQSAGTPRKHVCTKSNDISAKHSMGEFLNIFIAKVTAFERRKNVRCEYSVDLNVVV